MQLPLKDCELRKPETAAERAKYHDIRKRLLFDVYLPHLKYDPEHPDETKPNHHPMGFFYRDELIGTIRIDFMDEKRCAFRAVAIDEQYQNKGYGGILLKMAEAFSAKQGRNKIFLHVNGKAANFYVKNGYREIGDWGKKLDNNSISFGKTLPA